MLSEKFANRMSLFTINRAAFAYQADGTLLKISDGIFVSLEPATHDSSGRQPNTISEVCNIRLERKTVNFQSNCSSLVIVESFVLPF